MGNAMKVTARPQHNHGPTQVKNKFVQKEICDIDRVDMLLLLLICMHSFPFRRTSDTTHSRASASCFIKRMAQSNV